MVPNGWKLKKLNDVFKVIDSLHQTPTFSDTGLPMVRVTDVKGGILNLSNTVKVSEKVFSEYTKKYTPKKHDIVFSRVGSYGISSYVDSNEPFCLGQNTVIAESNDNAVSKYIFNVLKSTYVKRQIERTVDGSSHKTVSLKVIRALDIPIPPLPEQRKIAQILSTWDRGIATTEKLIDASKQQKKALMQQLLTGKKRLVDPETGKAFEGEWEEVKLGDVISLGRGFAFKSSQYADSGTKVVRVTNIASSGHIDLSDCVYVPNEITNEYQKYALKNEDILLVMVGATAGKLGFVSENILPSLLNQNMWSLRTRNLDKLNQPFLRHIAERIVARYMLTQQGSARGFFTQSTFELVNFQVPSVEEQKKIASVLTAADKEIELLEAKLAHLKQEKKALMQQLLTGKRRVKVAETEAA